MEQLKKAFTVYVSKMNTQAFLFSHNLTGFERAYENICDECKQFEQYLTALFRYGFIKDDEYEFYYNLCFRFERNYHDKLFSF